MIFRRSYQKVNYLFKRDSCDLIETNSHRGVTAVQLMNKHRVGINSPHDRCTFEKERGAAGASFEKNIERFCRNFTVFNQSPQSVTCPQCPRRRRVRRHRLTHKLGKADSFPLSGRLRVHCPEISTSRLERCQPRRVYMYVRLCTYRI